MKLSLTALCVLLLAPSVRAKGERWELGGVEFYGSDRVDADRFAAKHAADIRHMLNRWGAAAKPAQAQAEALRVKLEAAAKEMGGFGWAGLEVVELGDSEGGSSKVLLMVDVVEKDQMSQRYPFRPPPTKDVPDPAGLIAKWAGYEDAGRQAALASGADLKRTACPAFYCPEGTGTPEMNAVESLFLDKVAANKKALAEVLREDKDGRKRARALFLLTYLRDADEVIGHVLAALLDPDTRVREAGVTILNDIAIHHKDVVLPIKEAARMLDYPTSTDRQRALALFLSVGDNPDQRSLVYGPPADQFLRLLRTKHPGVRDMAHTLLSILSKESHAVDDYEAWDKWLWRARQAQIRKGGE
ncbi:MAG: HEAT repeat domain-containing protein [Elusimicrobia bacterium]|nr:HEAT repeat domain-containing protein [Elusimicrobiota bacterium]